MTAKRPYVVLLLWLILSIFTLFQICWLFVISVKPAVDLFTTPSVILHVPYWKNYFEVFQDETLRRYMLNSVIISTGNATLVTTLAFFACCALSRYDLVGKASIFFWTITIRMAPTAVFLLPFFLLFTQVFKIGDWMLYDTHIGMILLYCSFNLPFAIWTLRPTIDGIAKELDEAATVDGASAWQVVRQVMWPLAKPGLAVTLILTRGFRLKRVSAGRDANLDQRRHHHHRAVGIRHLDRNRMGQDVVDCHDHADPGAGGVWRRAAPYRRGPDFWRGEGVTDGRHHKTQTRLFADRQQRVRPPVHRHLSVCRAGIAAAGGDRAIHPVDLLPYPRAWVGCVDSVARLTHSTN